MQSFQDRVLKVVNQYLKDKYGSGFYYELVGSASRKLVTERINGNRGYDFDYNLVIDEPSLFGRNVIDVTSAGYEYTWDAHQIKERFREAFNYAVDGTEFDFPDDSSSVLTINCYSKDRNRILYGADLAIVFYDRNGVIHTLEHYKTHDAFSSDGYGFQIRNTSYGIDIKLDEIIEFLDDGWDLIREEYLKLKNSNEDDDKKSFILFVEAVNNVRHNYDKEIYDEMDSQGYVGPLT